MSDTTALETRLQKLEDLEAIRTLTATYAHAVDRGWNGSEIDSKTIATVFTEDATWKSAAFGMEMAGREQIVAGLSVVEPTPFAMHSFTNPVIDIAGDTAKATWLLWVSVEMGGTKNLISQSEDLTYARTASGWQIASIDLHFGQMLNG